MRFIFAIKYKLMLQNRIFQTKANHIDQKNKNLTHYGIRFLAKIVEAVRLASTIFQFIALYLLNGQNFLVFETQRIMRLMQVTNQFLQSW